MTSLDARPSTFDSVIADIDRVARRLGVTLQQEDALLRDIYGRVAVYLKAAPAEGKAERLASELVALGPYVRQERTVVVAGDATAEAVLGDQSRVQWVRASDGRFLRVVERRLVGLDWVAPPVAELVKGPRRIAFASMKGGVGRSTALCAAAAHLARQGKNVLVIDLDLEAPGVGSMLAGSKLSEHGVVDWLAAASVGATVPVSSLVARSFLATDGVVDVVPAYGRSSQGSPESYLAKLGRALADVSIGEARPIHERVACLIDELCGERPYDAVLVDARAGLSETTAGAIISLGATVLCFGTAQQQSLEDYRFLFAHLASLARPGDGPVWKHLVPVLAKAASGEQNARAQDAMFDLFERYFYEEQPGIDDDVYHYGADDDDAPHKLVPIAFNPAFATFDPEARPNDVDESLRDAMFAPFLAAIDRIIRGSTGEAGAS